MNQELEYVRSPLLLSRHTTRVLVIDVQEKLVPAIASHEALIRNCADLLQSANLLEVPIAGTEQYPKGLGSTVAKLAESLPTCTEKLRFSSAEVLDWSIEDTNGNARHQVVVFGMEAHVCVQQTVLDLLSQGFSVHVPVDAVGSRFELDHRTAIDRMRDSGATITTTETVIFELCETAADPQFKAISSMIRARGSES